MEGDFPFVVTAGWTRRVLWPLAALGFAAGAVFMPVLDLPLWAKFAGPAALALFAFFSARTAIRTWLERATFYADRIVTRRWFKEREIRRDQIIGLRSDYKGADVALLTREDEDDPFELSTFEVQDEDVWAWLEDIPNFDMRDAEAREDQFLSDARFGDTPRQRRATRKRLERISQWLFFASMTGAAWTVFFPAPYLWAIAASAAWPFAIVLLYLLNPERFSLSFSDDQPDFRQSIGACIGFAAAGLAIRAVTDFHFPEWPLLLAGCVPVAAAVTLLLRRLDGVLRTTPVVLALVFPLAYVYGLAAQADVLFVPPTNVQVFTIVSTGDKNTIFTLYATPDGGNGQVQAILVDPITQVSAHAKGKLCVCSGTGRLGLRFSFAVLCPPQHR